MNADPAANSPAPVDMIPVPTQPGRIVGAVTYREGDGPLIVIRPGAVGVQLTATDAILSWTDGETRGSASMPIGIFRVFVAEGAVELPA